MKDTQEIEALIERIRAGDVEAREHLFAKLADREREGAAVVAMARRVLPAGHWARRLVESEDLVQSALLTAWDEVDRFRGETPESFYAWIRSILRTKLNRVTRRGKVESLSAEELDRALNSASPSSAGVEDALVKRERVEALSAAIAALPDDQREVFDLRLRGLNASEIGQVLGLNSPTVRKRESRAVQKLREALQ